MGKLNKLFGSLTGIRKATDTAGSESFPPVPVKTHHIATNHGSPNLTDMHGTKRKDSSETQKTLKSSDESTRPVVGDSYLEFVNFCGGSDEGDHGGLANSKPTDPNIGKTVEYAVESRPTPTSGTGQCPFRHGTVYARPYPGYAHGNPKKGICPTGCRPEMDCDITDHETVKETLLREATEFTNLYYHEREDEMNGSAGFKSKEDRINYIQESIETSGTYEHTFDEIQHGARVAWRNAPKCSNRKYWQNLKLIDCRTAETNKDMFGCCLQHLSKAMACGSSEAYISVFKPAKPGTVDGPRIWNGQLLSYAAYVSGVNVIGDPINLRFTQMVEERFGWKGPPDGKQGAYDYLPLIIQADPQGNPELFELPLNCAPPVHIFHPKYPELSQLSMQWYPTPAVCALDLTLGGLVYTAVPFNGWYADTEVLRDLVDEDRYNLIVPIAKTLGLNTELKPGEPPYYKEDVLSILCKAIYHSFKSAKVAMIDHHTLIDMFWVWYCDEMASRKYCPVNWKWVIPPISASTNSAYLGLSKAQEYTLKPAYLIGRGFVQLEEEAFGKRSLEGPFQNFFVTMIFGIRMKRWVAEIRARKPAALIIYASVTGNAQTHAADLGSILSSCCSITFFDACGVNAPSDPKIMSQVKDAKMVIFVSSTQGNGEIPSLSVNFFSRLFSENSYLLKEKECAVLGFGSSAYPIFCGGAVFISTMLARCGAMELVFRGECDAVKGEGQTFNAWTCSLVIKMASNPSASPRVVELSQSIQDSKSSILGKRRDILDSLDVQIFSEDRCKTAVGNVFITRRGDLTGPMNAGSIRRSQMRRGRGDLSRLQSLRQIIVSTLEEDESDNVFVGTVKSRSEMIHEVGCNEEEKERGTSLIKIDLQGSGNPPYEPGDHVRVYPCNSISQERLEIFVGHLSRNLALDDQIYVTLESEDLRSDLKVHLPLLNSTLDSLVPLRGLFEKEVAVNAPISMEACVDLAQIASEEAEKLVLQELGNDEDEYEKMIGMCGLKWIDLFEHFPSLSTKVDIKFLLYSMRKNHVRSYSISSCKAIVGPEMHLVVGRFVYSRGSGDNKKIEVGVCSNYLSSILPGEEVMFELESMRHFHLPPDPSSPVFFICAGTGYAPFRGLLQKRAHFQSRGEKLGPAYLIFGSRSSKEGLFHDEIREFHEKEVLSGVFFCYSREPGTKKTYTTDKLRSAEVKTILVPFMSQANSHIFICGSANMAEGCKTVLQEILPRDCFDSITKDGRIHCDVFGALA